MIQGYSFHPGPSPTPTASPGPSPGVQRALGCTPAPGPATRPGAAAHSPPHVSLEPAEPPEVTGRGPPGPSPPLLGSAQPRGPRSNSAELSEASQSTRSRTDASSPWAPMSHGRGAGPQSPTELQLKLAELAEVMECLTTLRPPPSGPPDTRPPPTPPTPHLHPDRDVHRGPPPPYPSVTDPNAHCRSDTRRADRHGPVAQAQSAGVGRAPAQADAHLDSSPHYKPPQWPPPQGTSLGCAAPSRAPEYDAVGRQSPDSARPLPPQTSRGAACAAGQPLWQALPSFGEQPPVLPSPRSAALQPPSPSQACAVCKALSPLSAAPEPRVRAPAPTPDPRRHRTPPEPLDPLTLAPPWAPALHSVPADVKSAAVHAWVTAQAVGLPAELADAPIAAPTGPCNAVVGALGCSKAPKGRTGTPLALCSSISGLDGFPQACSPHDSPRCVPTDAAVIPWAPGLSEEGGFLGTLCNQQVLRFITCLLLHLLPSCVLHLLVAPPSLPPSLPSGLVVCE